VGKVDEEYKTKEDEESCPNQSHIIPPEHEESIRDEEGDDDKDQPEEDLGAPPTALNLSQVRQLREEETNPFWIAARLSLVSRTPMREKLSNRWRRTSAKQMRWT